MVDQPPPALMSGPVVFAHRGNAIPGDAPAHALNPRERERHRLQNHPHRRDTYLLGRLLWRSGAASFCATEELVMPDVAGLPASGRPEIEGQPFGCALTHTDGLQLAAFHRGAVGLDAEHARRRVPWRRLAQRWFSREETLWLSEHDSPEAAFLLLWTLKEAWVKATERGLADNLQALSRLPGAGVDRFLLDTDCSRWRAATALVDGFRVSILWRDGGMPAWRDVPVPGEPASAWRDTEWTRLELSS